MWKKLSIASKLILSLALVVVLGFSSLVIEQWITLKDGLHTLEIKNRQAIIALMSQNISGAVRWKKADVIEKAYAEFVESPNSTVSNIVVSGMDGTVLTEFTHSVLPTTEMISRLPGIYQQLGDEISLGLAPVIIKQIYDALPGIVDGGMAAIIVEQDISKALSVSSRVYCLQEGRVSLEGRSGEVTREAISHAYFGN